MIFDPLTRLRGRQDIHKIALIALQTCVENVFGEMADTPSAANVLRKVMAGLMDAAVQMARLDEPLFNLASTDVT
ncbi:MAG: hypothetical protein AB7U34_07530 [Novosphingobium sp.]